MIDFMYSNEGQILMTYGPMADANGDGGFWYCEKATAAQIADGDYFTYRGVKYHGTSYNGRSTPTLTEKTMNSFKGLTVNGFKLTDDEAFSTSCVLNFTNYARRVIGSCLPIGIVKDQGFENQMTSQTGKDSALKVSASLNNGTTKHVSLTYGDDLWYSSMTSSLPLTSQQSTALTADSQATLRSATTKVGSVKTVWSIFTEIIMNGLSTATDGTARSVTANADSGITYKVGTTAAACKEYMESLNIGARVTTFNGAWSSLKTYAQSIGLMN
jgi:hypothetical protein